jgi:RNA polymerase sigma-70 factor (ECF subfamily)
MAMNALLDELAPYVGRICGGIALEHGDDATQEALIAVLRNIGGLREPEAVRGWARTIATREAVRVARRGRRETPVETLDARLPAHGDATTVVEIRDQLARLEPEHRAVLVLRDLEGLDEASVASLLDVPTGTVKSRLHRARARFREGWSL